MLASREGPGGKERETRDELIIAGRKPFVALVDQQPQHAPVVGVDLGYSATQASCGICSSWAPEPEEVQFGQAAGRVFDLLSEEPDAVLAVAAVLSTFHDPETGNPDIRGKLESGRGWYYGAGVLSFAAAQRRRASKRVAPPTIYDLCIARKALRAGHPSG